MQRSIIWSWVLWSRHEWHKNTWNLTIRYAEGGLAASGDQAPALSDRLKEAMHPTHGINLFLFREWFALVEHRAALLAE